MRRRDFEVVANALLDARPPSTALAELQQWMRVCEKLVDVFKQQADAFERERFLKNCGYPSQLTPPPL